MDSRKLTDCEYYLKGTCVKGESCPFRHSEEAKSNGRDCKYWLGGTCMNLACKYIHRSASHLQRLAPTPAALQKPILTPEQRASTVCYFFINGQCTKGDACPFSHDLSLIQKNVATAAQNKQAEEPAEEGKSFGRNDLRTVARQVAKSRQSEQSDRVSDGGSNRNGNSGRRDQNRDARPNQRNRRQQDSADSQISKEAAELMKGGDVRARLKRFGAEKDAEPADYGVKSLDQLQNDKKRQRDQTDEHPDDVEDHPNPEGTSISEDNPAKRRRLSESGSGNGNLNIDVDQPEDDVEVDI